MSDIVYKLGLNEAYAKALSTNDNILEQLKIVLEEAGVGADGDVENGPCYVEMAASLPSKVPSENRKILIGWIKEGALKQSNKFDAAIKALKKSVTPLDAAGIAKLKTSCGYGEEVSEDEVKKVVSEEVSAAADLLKAQRYIGAGRVAGAVNSRVKWADSAVVKQHFDAAVEALIGPMNEKENLWSTTKDSKLKKSLAKELRSMAAPVPKPAKEAKAKTEKKKVEKKVEEEEEVEELAEGRYIPWADNPEDILERVRKDTDGAVLTRFPPEPNGYLHLGHAKAMRFNFTVANERKGKTYLRFDDTNPSAEKQEYIDQIIANATWLGHKPWKITYSSDYFHELYKLAVQLIKADGAYVCHETSEQMRKGREEMTPSPWRDRPIEESLKLFEDMRKGKFAEGEATLRMKGDYKHDMPCMRDLVAYRIQYLPHPRTGNEWCVYPSYDFTHCIIDSLENITYSLCTLEFEVRRESYYWLLWKLNLYRPKVWEYSRLNLEYNVMSKRKLKELVEKNYVNGWDDPRLLTLNGLRRRGFTAEVLNTFCEEVGVTRNSNTVRLDRFLAVARRILNETSPRAMVVQDPVKVVLTNYPANKVQQLKAPLFPNDDSKGERTMPFSKVIYIERDDFKKVDEKGYRRLAPNKKVHLKYGYDIECTDFVEVDGVVTEIRATVDLSDDSFHNANKLKGVIHWVAEPASGKDPLKVTLNQYDILFTEPLVGGEDWLDLINKDSLKTVVGFAEPHLKNTKSEDKYQFERLGYFSADFDTKANAILFNRTCTLRDTYKVKK